jgi:hypothetical protein
MNLGVSSGTGRGGRCRRLLVSLRARQIWREKGERPGTDIEDWNQAEDEYERQRFGLLVRLILNVPKQVARVIFNLPEPVLKSLDLYLKLIIFPITLIAGVVALLNYLETTNQDKLKISSSYADRYGQEPFLTIRDALTEFIGGKELLGAKPDTFDAIVKQFVDTADHKKLIMRQYYLFNDMSFCSNEGLCSREYLCDRFAGDVSAFRNTFFAFFKQLSREWRECLMDVNDTFLMSCGDAKLRPWPKSEIGIQCKLSSD